jgi:hypothetical protein
MVSRKRGFNVMWCDWFNPAWFTPANLVAEWMRHGAHTRAIRAVTLAIVLLLCCAPQMMALAAYIDTIGIDAFLSLLELQLLVGLALLIKTPRPRLGKSAARFKGVVSRRWRVIRWCIACWLEPIRRGRPARVP